MVIIVLCDAVKNATTSNKAMRGPTKPQPFNLTQSKKSSDTVDNANKFVSLAEMNMKFHSQTPQRFRTKSKKGKKPSPCYILVRILYSSHLQLI